MAHAIPTNDACGFAGCLTISSTTLFTELVYTGSVNTSSALPVNNYVLPQLTDYFPNGNPLRSCTTASLVAYTQNAQPVLAKRAANPEPIAINTFPAAPSLTPAITYTAEANRVDNLPPSSSPAGGDNGGTASDENASLTSPSDTPSTIPSSSQQSSQTRSETSEAPPSTTSDASDTQTATSTAFSTENPPQNSNSALGTMSFTGTVAGTAGNSTSAQPSTWNFVCSSEGCTLASSSETSTTSPNASSTDTEAQSTTQSSSARVALSRGMAGVILMMVLFAMF